MRLICVMRLKTFWLLKDRLNLLLLLTSAIIITSSFVKVRRNIKVLKKKGPSLRRGKLIANLLNNLSSRIDKTGCHLLLSKKNPLLTLSNLKDHYLSRNPTIQVQFLRKCRL